MAYFVGMGRLMVYHFLPPCNSYDTFQALFGRAPTSVPEHYETSAIQAENYLHNIPATSPT